VAGKDRDREPVSDHDCPSRGEVVEVRRLGSDDADLVEVVDQINAATMEIGEPFSVGSLRGFVADVRNIYLVAHVGGQLAGTLHAIRYQHPSGSTYVYIDEVDTDEAFRRRGVATRLMAAVMEITRDSGASEAWLGADDGNDAAHALYRKLQPSEVEPGVIYSYKV